MTLGRKVYLSPGGAFRDSVIGMFLSHGFKGTNKVDEASVVCWLGGADVDPQLYGETPLRYTSINPIMDNYDLTTWRAVENSDVFKVGICRGGQFLNIMNGGKLWQHIDNHDHGTHEVFDLHLNKSIRVTSIHHQQMIPAKNATIVALCSIANEKQSVGKYWNLEDPRSVGNYARTLTHNRSDYEVLFYKDTNALCWQPHPEVDDGPGQDYFFETLDRFFFRKKR